jgi:hypothetical protein
MLAAIVGHARAASPFYRELYAGIDPERFELADLPPVTKPQLMDRFDDWVTDPTIDLAGAERHLEGLSGDRLHLGRYRVVASSDSTGRRGIFVYSRRDWLVNLANFGRLNEQFVGIRPRLSPSLPAPGSRRLPVRPRPPGRGAACGPPRRATDDRGHRLRGPDLGDGGRHPRCMADATFHWYGITEGGVLAGDCEHHRGMHLFVDLFIVENSTIGAGPFPTARSGTGCSSPTCSTGPSR